MCCVAQRRVLSFAASRFPVTGMRIFVRNLEAQVVEYDVEPGDSVQTLKDKIHDKTGFPLCFQRLIFEGRQLEEFRMLGDYVQQGSQVVLVGRFLGA
jgi:hypothetical protein